MAVTPPSPISPWAVAFCVVSFDIELGQKLDSIYPPNVEFGEDEIVQVCFNSFPDSNMGIDGGLVYFFRIKRTRMSHEPSSAAAKKKSRMTTGQRYYYAYVYFTQKKDSRCKRGYLQKSLVLITKRPYIGLYKKVVKNIGHHFFEFDHAAPEADGDTGSELLQTCFNNILRWPPLVEGDTFELPILGSVLRYRIPHTSAPHILDASAFAGAKDSLVSNMQSVNIFSSFHKLLSHLWTLWELVLLGEPILVISSSPAKCCEGVFSLVSLISPLTYGGDYRPYFTIHDPDFKTITSLNIEDPAANTLHHYSTIIGVTNPFFLKALDNWPHRLCIGMEPLKGRGASNRHKTEKDYVKTSYKPITPINKTVLNEVILTKHKVVVEEMVNNEVLRRHFMRITENFLVPLQRYFTSLLPLANTITPFDNPPALRSWNKQEFLDNIEPSTSPSNVTSSSFWGGIGIGSAWFSATRSSEALSTPVEFSETAAANTSSDPYISASFSNSANTKKSPSKMGGIRELYRRFMETATFSLWYKSKKRAALQELNKRYVREYCDCDLVKILEGKRDMDIIDMYIRSKDILEYYRLDETQKDKLRKQQEILIRLLPKELKEMMNEKEKERRSRHFEKEEDVAPLSDDEVKLSLSASLRSGQEQKPKKDKSYMVNPPASPPHTLNRFISAPTPQL